MTRYVKQPYERYRSQTVINGPSKTKQSFAEGANINNIMKRFEKTGVLPVTSARPLEGQIPDVTTFQDAMNICALANSLFDALPAEVRSRFHNDPRKFLAFVEDENNEAEMVKLGLVRAPEPVPVPAPENSEETKETVEPVSNPPPSGQ